MTYCSKSASDALHAGFDLRRGFGGVTRNPHRGLQEALGLRDLKDLAALDAFNQDFNVAVWQLEALHDVDDGADLENVVGLWVRRCEASCWVARKIFLSPANASSRACTLDSRPTTNGVIMYGKMTTSRMGIIGSFLLSNFSLGFDKLWSPISVYALELTSGAEARYAFDRMRPSRTRALPS